MQLPALFSLPIDPVHYLHPHAVIQDLEPGFPALLSDNPMPPRLLKLDRGERTGLHPTFS